MPGIARCFGAAILGALPAALSVAGQTAWSPQPSALTQHYRAAQAAMEHGDKETASYHWRMFLTDALGEIAISNAQAGAYQRAASLFEEALSFAPHSTELLLAYADAALNSGDLDTAHALAAQAARETPQNAQGHMLLGRVLLKQQKNAEARAQFEQAAALDPTFPAGYDLAVACLNLGDVKCADATFAEMRGSYGDSAVFDLYAGQAYLNSDFQNRAVDAFKAAIAKDPHLPGAHYSLAAAELATNAGVDVAEDELRQEIALTPSEAVAYAALGHLEQGQHRSAEAERDLKRAIALAPEDPDAYLYLGELYAEQKRAPEAMTALRRSIELTTDVSRNNTQVRRAHYLLGRLLLQHGDTEAGQKEIAISQSLMHRSLSEARDRLADYYQEPAAGSGSEPAPQAQAASTSTIDPKAAQRAAALEKQLSPAVADIYNNLGAMAGGAGRYAEAFKDFERAFEWNPRLPDLDENLGRAAYAAGQYADAVGPLNRYVDGHPEDEALRSALGLSQSMTGNYADAVKNLAPLVHSGKASPQVLFAYADALLRTSHAKAAADTLSGLAAKLPQSAQVQRELGQALAAANRPAQAAAALQKAIDLDPKDTRAWIALGGVQMQQGQNAAAVHSLQSAVALDEGNADVHRALASAYKVAGRDADAAREMQRYQELAANSSDKSAHR